MASVTPSVDLIHLGMDTSRDTIVVGILRPGEEIPAVDRVFNDEASVRRLIGRFADRSVLSACYEAGPGGYELHRLLTSMGVACEVVAPSLVPKGGSERVKTDKRDAIRLARLHRAGELTAIHIPTPDQEAVRDLVRVRGDLLADRKRAQVRITAMLMRHGRVWRAGAKWTATHRAWLGGAELRGAGAGGDVRALPGRAGHPGDRAGRHRVRAGRVGVWWFAGAGGGPAGLLPGGGDADRADPGQRGDRLAAVPHRAGVHGFHRAGAQRVLQW